MDDVLHDPVVKDALDPKLWFFLKVLYTDNRGMNLRNLVAHGVAPAGAFNRVNAALVVQSVVFLALIRHEAMYVEVARFWMRPRGEVKRDVRRVEERSAGDVSFLLAGVCSE